MGQLMRLGAKAYAIGLLLALVARMGSADGGGTAPAAKPDPAKVAAARTAALRARATEWLDARKGLVGTCPKCEGAGTLVVHRGHFVQRETCLTCNGTGRIISPKRWQRIRYELLTPAKRLTIKVDDLLAQLKATPVDSPDTGFLKAWRIDRIDLVGDRFGRVRAFEAREPIARESQWVEAPDPSTSAAAWFLYSPDTDGPWVEAPATPSVPGDPVAKVDPLKSGENEALRTKLALANASHAFAAGQREGKTLVVSVFDAKALDAKALDDSIAKDIVPLSRAALEAIPDADAVRIVFLAQWCDRFGAVAKKPYHTAEISRETFAQIHFENLTPDRQLALWTIRETLQPGEVMWWKPDASEAPR